MPGKLSKVPYAEPTWLTEGYHSPYFKEVRAFYSVSRQASQLFRLAKTRRAMADYSTSE